jgi:hypothetical protein
MRFPNINNVREKWYASNVKEVATISNKKQIDKPGNPCSNIAVSLTKKWGILE